MSGNKHMTALGMPFDMASLRAKNEKVRAVGNMNVNARGDIIDSHNRVINDATKRVNGMYQKTMQQTHPAARPAPAAQATAAPKPVVKKEEVNDIRPDELLDLDDDIPNPEK